MKERAERHLEEYSRLILDMQERRERDEFRVELYTLRCAIREHVREQNRAVSVIEEWAQDMDGRRCYGCVIMDEKIGVYEARACPLLNGPYTVP